MTASTCIPPGVLAKNTERGLFIKLRANDQHMSQPIAIGARLSAFPGITTLGARPNLKDYSMEEMALIRRADKIYYPSSALARPLAALGKRLFPSLSCHILEGDKILQSALFDLLGVPQPRTRVFYGRQREHITSHFSFPFIAKTPRASALGRGVFLIEKPCQLDDYLSAHNPAYIQERLPIDGDVRVVIIGRDPVCAYWRRSAPGEYRSNLAQGGTVDFCGVPREALKLAVETARAADLDEVGMDVAVVGGRPFLLEFTMKYGHQGPSLAGIDIPALVAKTILAGEL